MTDALSLVDSEEASLAIVPAETPMKALAELVSLSLHYNNEIPELGSARAEQVAPYFNVLAESKVVSRKQSSFGDSVVSVNFDQLTWRSQRVQRDGVFLCSKAPEVTEVRQLSKVSMLEEFIKMGWKIEKAPRPLTLESARVVDLNNLFRSKSYWAALLDSGNILGPKGCPQICHDKPYGYYECLLHLDQRKLADMRAHPEYARFKNPEYLRILKEQSIEIPALGDVDAMLALEDNPETVAMAPMLRVPSVSTKRLVSRDGKHHIYFDNFSHSSGSRRAFIKCSNTTHHTPTYECQRYCTLHLFPSDRHACAFLIAWKVEGHTSVDRENHKLFFPTDTQREKALSLVP